MKSKFKKGQKIPKNVIKMFTISSAVGAIIKSNHNGDPKLSTLAIQVNRAMRVFSIQAGREVYNGVSKEVGEIWEEIVDKYSNSIKEEQVPVYIEMLCSLVSDKDYKEFLGISKYKAEKSLYISDNALEGILYLDVAINKLYGCKPTTYPLRREVQLREKPKRDKKVSSRAIKHAKEVQQHIDWKKKKSAFMAKLREARIQREEDAKREK